VVAVAWHDTEELAAAWLSSGEERARARVTMAAAYRRRRRRGKTKRLKQL
jgi:hypothetical protein